MSFRTNRRSEAELTFSDTELRDLAIAWVVLSVAFALLLAPIHRGASIGAFVTMVGLSFVTVGVAFLLHELAHKVVAIEYGQVAQFRADYQMLFLAIMSALIGFLFAAPGAVYHRGRITVEENGHIAIAGPVTNVILALMFFPLLLFSGQSGLAGFLGTVGHMGVLINLFLAAFKMIPFGPLDGKSVIQWSKPVFAGFFVTSLVLLAGFILTFGIWPW